MARKNKNNDEGSGADIGVVMTCSLFLIILTFFILLNSIAVIDDRKQRLAIGSLVGSFGSLSGGLSTLKTGESMMPSSVPLVEHSMDMNAFLGKLNKSLHKKFKVDQSRGKAAITIQADVLFKEGATIMTLDRVPVLDRLSDFINQGNYAVEVAGHTDNRPAVQKGYASNWEITSFMAMQVFQYLVEKGRVAPQRITAYGRGDQDPASSNDTSASRKLNRRVDVILKFNTPQAAKTIFGERSSGNFTYKRFNFEVF